MAACRLFAYRNAIASKYPAGQLRREQGQSSFWCDDEWRGRILQLLTVPTQGSGDPFAWNELHVLGYVALEQGQTESARGACSIVGRSLCLFNNHRYEKCCNR